MLRDANSPAFDGIFLLLRYDPAFLGRMYIFLLFTTCARRAIIIMVYYALMAANTSDRLAITNATNRRKANAPKSYKLGRQGWPRSTVTAANRLIDVIDGA